MPLFVISTLIQILLIVHVVRTGRDRIWIWVLLMLPMAGGLAYLVMELIPEWRGTIGGQRALRGVKQALNPAAQVRHQADAWEQSPNAENGRHYADALLASGRYEEALAIARQAARGFFADEPLLMLAQAQALFGLEKYTECVQTLDQLISNNPEFKSAEGHLLYARALEKNGQTEQALKEYQSVATYFPGAEARYRLGEALHNSGQQAASRDIFEQILKDARLAPAHFRKSQKSWLNKAKAALNN